MISGSVVKNDAQRVAFTRAQLTDAVAHFHSIETAPAELRSFVDRECHTVSFFEAYNFDP